MRVSLTKIKFRVNLRTAPDQLVSVRNRCGHPFVHRPLDQSVGGDGDIDVNGDGGDDDPVHEDLLQAVERSYVEVPAAAAAAYVQPAVEPAYLSHQYLDEQPTVFAAEYSPLPVNGAYATDYHLPTSPYLAPYSTHSNYAAPATVAAPANVAVVAAPVAIASHGDYQSVSPPSSPSTSSGSMGVVTTNSTNEYQKYKSVELGDELTPHPPGWDKNPEFCQTKLRAYRSRIRKRSNVVIIFLGKMSNLVCP